MARVFGMLEMHVSQNVYAGNGDVRRKHGGGGRMQNAGIVSERMGHQLVKRTDGGDKVRHSEKNKK